jgi:predicted adenylyl cyclase CyaB
MPRNLELKARVPSGPAAIARARECGAEFSDTLLQIDTYFHVTSGRLKMREQYARAAELIHYFREENSTERWSDYQRIPIADPSALKSALRGALGILAIVEKERLLFMYKGARIHIDEVKSLGAFLEFEVPANGSELPEALMRELRMIFGVVEQDVEKGSYSDLILVKSSS